MRIVHTAKSKDGFIVQHLHIDEDFHYDLAVNCKSLLTSLLNKNKIKYLLFSFSHILDGTSIFMIIAEIAELFTSNGGAVVFVLEKQNFTYFENVFGHHSFVLYSATIDEAFVIINEIECTEK